MAKKLAELIVAMKKDEVLAEVKQRVDSGAEALTLVDECREGMQIVGEKFQTGESFLAELVLSGVIFKEVLEVLKPQMEKEGAGESRGKVIMATLKGDIHDLGKDIVSIQLKAQGFEVEDLGVDVDPMIVMDKIKEISPDFVGFSSLLTPNLQVMKQCVEMIKEQGLRDTLKVMIGGGVTTPQAREFVGADFQATDSTKGVQFCLDTMGGK